MHITLHLALKNINEVKEKVGKQQNEFKILLLITSDYETLIIHSYISSEIV